MLKYIWCVSQQKCTCDREDVIKWNHFPRYCPFVRGIHRSLVNSPHKGQWCEGLMFSLICAWINGWVNTREAGDLRHHRAHFDVTVMILCLLYCGYHTNFCGFVSSIRLPARWASVPWRPPAMYHLVSFMCTCDYVNLYLVIFDCTLLENNLTINITTTITIYPYFSWLFHWHDCPSANEVIMQDMGKIGG